MCTQKTELRQVTTSLSHSPNRSTFSFLAASSSQHNVVSDRGEILTLMHNLLRCRHTSAKIEKKDNKCGNWIL